MIEMNKLKASMSLVFEMKYLSATKKVHRIGFLKIDPLAHLIYSRSSTLNDVKLRTTPFDKLC